MRAALPFIEYTPDQAYMPAMTELTLEVCGPDQKEALDALVEFLNRLIEEDQEPANGPSG